MMMITMTTTTTTTTTIIIKIIAKKIELSEFSFTKLNHQVISQNT